MFGCFGHKRNSVKIVSDGGKENGSQCIAKVLLSSTIWFKEG